MKTLKSLLYMALLMAYFKVGFALGFGVLWSGGALIVLALLWAGLKKLGGAGRENWGRVE